MRDMKSKFTKTTSNFFQIGGRAPVALVLNPPISVLPSSVARIFMNF